MTVLAPEWLEGIAQFNDREYYACHDTLEALWMDAIDPDKKFYQGVLQIAVACYHLHNHNWQGAAILLGEGMGRLRYYQPVYGEIDVSELLQQSNNLLQLLQTVGSEGVVDFVERLRQDPTPLPVLKFFTSLDKVLGARCDYYTSIENRNAECGVKYIHRDLDATMSDLTIS